MEGVGMKKKSGGKRSQAAGTQPSRLTHSARPWLLTSTGLWRVKPARMFTSTAQAACLNPVRADCYPLVCGPLNGISLTTGQPWWHSVHELNRAGVISGSNAVAFGGYGEGKSSLGKTTYGSRALAYGARVAVFDRKRQHEAGRADDRGEYLRLAEMVGGTVVTFDRTPGRGTIVNPLDPQIVAVGSDEAGVGQDELLLMCAELACGYELRNRSEDVVSGPQWALQKAHRAARAAATAQGRVPVLQDVIDALYTPGMDAVPGPSDQTGRKLVEARGIVTLDDVTKWGLGVAMNLEKYTGDGPMAGLIDGPTRAADGGRLDLSDRLIVFDTSSLGEGSDALGLMVGMMAGFIQAVWSAIPGDKYLLNEEAYFAARLTGVSQHMLEWAKRGRAKGISTVTFFHRLSDFQEGSDLWALVKEADVIHVFRQEDKDEAAATARMFGLDWGTYGEILTSLPQGSHLLLVTGRQPEQIQHLRTRDEEWLTDTGGGMAGLARANTTPPPVVVDEAVWSHA